jgi:outer membrane protein assembly factor BamB
VWLAEYEQTDIPATFAWYETKDRAVTWRTSPVSATPRAVLLAPTDSAHLFALDPSTGALLWRHAQRPAASVQYQWFLGAAEGRAFLLGSKLAALDVESGRPLWTDPEAGRLAPPRERATPATGAGLIAPGAVWAPVQGGLVEIDARTGSFRSVRRFPAPPESKPPRPEPRPARPPGDLVAGDGALLVASERAIDCYYRFEDLRERLRQRLAAAPTDPALRLEAGEVFRVAGQLDEAVQCFERGLAVVDRAPGRTRERIDAGLRRALHETLLHRSGVRHQAGDSVGAYEDLDRAVAVARDRGDAVRALLAIAEAAGTGARSASGDAALRRVASEFGDVETTVDGVRVDAGALARFLLGERAAATRRTGEAIDLWLDLLDHSPDASVGTSSVAVAVRTRLDALVAEGGADVERRIASRARASLDAARGSKDVAALVRIARTSPTPEVAAEAGLLAAKALVDGGRAREAASTLEGLLQRGAAPPVRARALWLLASAYRGLEESARERQALRRLAGEAASVRLEDGRPAAEAAQAELAAERFREAPAALPDPRPPVGLLWETVGTDDPPLQLVTVQGARPRALEGRLLFVQDQVLAVADGATGESGWRTNLGVEVRAAYGARSAVVLAGDAAQLRSQRVQLEAVRTEDGTRLWTRQLGGKYLASTSALGVVYVLRQTTNERAERVIFLTAVLAETGEPLADRALGVSVAPVVTAAGDAVVVYEQVQAAQNPRRRATTLALEGSTLAVRGVLDVEGWTSPFSLVPGGTGIVVTTAQHNTVVAIDTATGAAAWPPVRVEGRTVKAVLAVPGGIVVTDDGDQVRRFDAASGKEVWLRKLGGAGNLGYAGEAAEGDLVVVTLVAAKGEESASAVALDAATGSERWRTRLPLEGSVRRVLPSPEVLASVVAYELNEKPGDEYRSKVVLLDRGDGRVVDRIAHPVIGRTLQRAFFDGRFVVLWAPPRADVAVYGPESRQR